GERREETGRGPHAQLFEYALDFFVRHVRQDFGGVRRLHILENPRELLVRGALGPGRLEREWSLIAGRTGPERGGRGTGRIRRRAVWGRVTWHVDRRGRTR